jgi:hypothetical protein
VKGFAIISLNNLVLYSMRKSDGKVYSVPELPQGALFPTYTTFAK